MSMFVTPPQNYLYNTNWNYFLSFQTTKQAKLLRHIIFRNRHVQCAHQVLFQRPFINCRRQLSITFALSNWGNLIVLDLGTSSVLITFPPLSQVISWTIQRPDNLVNYSDNGHDLFTGQAKVWLPNVSDNQMPSTMEI